MFRSWAAHWTLGLAPSAGHLDTNPQGYRAWSTWSRGQAWAIRGFISYGDYYYLHAIEARLALATTAMPLKRSRLWLHDGGVGAILADPIPQPTPPGLVSSRP